MSSTTVPNPANGSFPSRSCRLSAGCRPSMMYPTVLGPHPTFYLTASSSQLNLHIFHMGGRLNPPVEREDYILGPADSSHHNFLTQPITQSHRLPIQSLPPHSLPAPFSLPESLLNVNIPSLAYLEKRQMF